MTILMCDYETPTYNSIIKYNLKSCEPYIIGTKEFGKQEPLRININIRDWFDSLTYIEGQVKVYFHNLKFDGEFIQSYLIRSGYTPLNIGDKLIKNSFIVIEDEQSVYKISVKTEYNTIKFVCSYKLLVLSVKKLGESFKETWLKKGGIDYDKYHYFDCISKVTKELKEYLESDIYIVEKRLEIFFSQYQAKLTIASTSYNHMKKFIGEKEFRRMFGTSEEYLKPNEKNTYFSIKDYELLNSGYRGGLTVGKKKYSGVTLNNVWCVDVNSMYPSIMQQELLPYGRIIKVKPRYGNFVTLFKIHIYKGYRHDKDLPDVWYNTRSEKYLEKMENEEFITTDFEWETLKKIYTFEYTIVETWYWQAKVIFKEYIEELSYLKINAPNKAERENHKIIMNSGYGKFGQNPTKINKTWRKLKPEEQVRKGKTVYYCGKERWIKERSLTLSTTCNYMPIALFVTSYARTRLLEAMIANKENLVYVDTDSLWLLGKPKNIKIHESEFGDWKIEHKARAFKYLRPKTYIYNCDNKCICGNIGITVKCAGMNNKTKESFKLGILSWNDFFIGAKFPKGKTQIMRILGGMVVVDREFSITE